MLGERTKGHLDKSPLGQKPTGHNSTGEKPTAKFDIEDKSPLLQKLCSCCDRQLIFSVRQITSIVLPAKSYSDEHVFFTKLPGPYNR